MHRKDGKDPKDEEVRKKSWFDDQRDHGLRGLKGIDEPKPGDVFEVVAIAGDERHVELQSSGSNDGVPEAHFLLLPQGDGAFDDVVVQRNFDGGDSDLLKPGLPICR